ncbi:hypothetical protein RMR21_009470 [Agrobacterium sp. rho-8.1]|jgi:hypothetical protein|nr:hypothetical protein [Agrobacterium sp. rho-8.1]
MSALLNKPVKLLATAAATGAALLVVVMTFEGWMRHATDIFLATVQSGVAWCF